MRFVASCALAVLLVVAAPAGGAEGARYVVRLSAASVAERLSRQGMSSEAEGGKGPGEETGIHLNDHERQ